jgi:hypothetical protein
MSFIVTETSIKPVGGKRRWGEGRGGGGGGEVGGGGGVGKRGDISRFVTYTAYYVDLEPEKIGLSYNDREAEKHIEMTVA